MMTQNTGGRLSDATPHGTKLQSETFVLGKVLGQSRNTITYFSAHRQLKQRVVIKEFFPTGCIRIGASVQPGKDFPVAQFQAAKEEFLQAARSQIGLNHEGIAQVQSAFEENNTAYVVTAFVPGEGLNQLLMQQNRLAEPVAVAYGHQLGEALRAVHAAGLVHGGVRVDNIIINEEGRAVLVNFGRPTAAIPAGGQPQSAAIDDDQPGQPLPVATNGRLADIYDLGATLYHLLTGQAPLPLQARLGGDVLPSPQQINPGVSQSISDAVMWAMEPSEAARPQNIESMLARLVVSEPPASQSLTLKMPPRWAVVAAAAFLALVALVGIKRASNPASSQKVKVATATRGRTPRTAPVQPLRLSLDKRRQIFVVSSSQPLHLQKSGTIWTTKQEGKTIVCHPKKFPVIVKLLANGAGKFFLLRHDGQVLSPGWTLTDYRKLTAGRTLQTKIGSSQYRSLYFRAVGQPAIHIGAFYVGKAPAK